MYANKYLIKMKKISKITRNSFIYGFFDLIGLMINVILH